MVPRVVHQMSTSERKETENKFCKDETNKLRGEERITHYYQCCCSAERSFAAEDAAAEPVGHILLLLAAAAV